jgi:dTMP kinase
MIIEFCGIDGSGKSTLMDLVFRWLNERGIPTYQRTLRSTYKRILASVAARQGHSHWKAVFTPEEVEVAHALEMFTLVQSTITPINDETMVLLTDTYTARWLATAKLWDCSNLDRIREIYARLPSPNVSIFLDASIEIAFERMMSREKGDHALSLGNTEKLAKYRTSFEAILPQVPYKVYRTAADKNKNELLDEVLGYIRSSIPEIAKI